MLRRQNIIARLKTFYHICALGPAVYPESIELYGFGGHGRTTQPIFLAAEDRFG